MSVARLPKRAAGCEECARLEKTAYAARGDAANRRRVLARHTDDDLTARYTAEWREFSARADDATERYLIHHAEAHPIPVVTLPRTDNDAAPSHRKPKMPSAADLAERIRDGETLEEIAAEYDRSVPVVAKRLNAAGFNARTGEKGRRRDEDGLPVPIFAWSSPDWIDQALCAQTDPEIFFVEKGGSTREAKAVCARCPVRLKCLEEALRTGERHGVRGGLSERERRKLKKAAS